VESAGAPATEKPADDELVLVVSDLHLGADPELEDFYSDAEFADFLAYHAARDKRIHLVINGDFVDFLQIDPNGEARIERDQGTPLWLSETESVQSVVACGERHKVFFEALVKFASDENHRISILRGNHDLELAWPSVRDKLRALLGDPGPRLEFPIDAIFDEKTGLYIEHGAQYDPINATHNLRDPFLDRRRQKVEVPVGSVIVKVFWNRVEREFPHVDKIRPMWDSVSAVLVRRPTYLILRFDYFIDLLAGIFLASLSGFLRLAPRKDAPPPTESGDPRTLGRRLARPGVVGKWTALVIVAFIVFLVVRGALLWDEPGREPKVLRLLDSLFTHFAIGMGITVAAIGFARLLRLFLLRLPTLAMLRNVIYRLMVAGAAVVFFYSLLRMFWIPIGLLAGFYILLDAARSVSPGTDDPVGIPDEPEVLAALRMLKHDKVRTVIFGHTHVPLQIDLPSGKRYLNSGTWIRSIDLRNARSAPVELNTYVAVRGGRAELLSWRGTNPARLFGNPTPVPVLAASA
jgi:UDP-2,3-diacylglucosamine pyrophosphatase LpxH